MWEFVDQAWHYFEKVLSPLGMILLAMVVWQEIKAYLTRKRVGVVLDAKDAYSEKLTGKTLAMAVTVSNLTGLLEELVTWQRQRRGDGVSQ